MGQLLGHFWIIERQIFELYVRYAGGYLYMYQTRLHNSMNGIFTLKWSYTENRALSGVYVWRLPKNGTFLVQFWVHRGSNLQNIHALRTRVRSYVAKQRPEPSKTQILALNRPYKAKNALSGGI